MRQRLQHYNTKSIMQISISNFLSNASVQYFNLINLYTLGLNIIPTSYYVSQHIFRETGRWTNEERKLEKSKRLIENQNGRVLKVGFYISCLLLLTITIIFQIIDCSVLRFSSLHIYAVICIQKNYRLKKKLRKYL